MILLEDVFTSFTLILENYKSSNASRNVWKNILDPSWVWRSKFPLYDPLKLAYFEYWGWIEQIPFHCLTLVKFNENLRSKCKKKISVFKITMAFRQINCHEKPWKWSQNCCTNFFLFFFSNEVVTAWNIDNFLSLFVQLYVLRYVSAFRKIFTREQSNSRKRENNFKYLFFREYLARTGETINSKSRT